MASPAFPTYHFCWLRDGSFTAHAMDTAGEYSSAEAFFRWAGSVICRYGSKVDAVRQQLASGKPIGKDDTLHTRFTLDGKEDTTDDTWGNFQIDGYGTWLWALSEHVKLTGNTALLNDLGNAIEITVRYLELVWKLPNYDCWEEHFEYLHPSSLGTVYAGLKAVSSLIESGMMAPLSIEVNSLAAVVKEFILHYGVHQNCLVKMISPGKGNNPPQPVTESSVDSSLLGLIIPYNVFQPDELLSQSTVNAIESELHRTGGGVYRYKADVYYGGGEWLLLTAWLGWYYARIGKIDQAEKLCQWIEANADENGFMPEQVSQHLLAPEHQQPWIKKWGQVASPLLWSHAMYIILVNAILEGKKR